jgi:hypothetical protein
MTVRNKFEEMLERLVNEDRSGAEEMFHEIVVERSREIYENLLAEEADEDEDEDMDEATDEEVDESDEELDEADDEEVDEAADEEELDENFFDEAGDETGDMTMDIEMPGDEMGGDMGGMDDMGDMDMGDEGGDVEDRVADLEDELEALKAEFEALMGDEDSEEADDEMDMGDEEGEEADDAMDMGDEEGEEKPEESFNFGETKAVKKSQAELMREYANKVAPAKMGDNGVNAKSTVAGKNNMGGTTANIAKGGESKGEGTAGGLANNKPQTMNTKNVNTVGGNGASKLTAQPKGHGAEKKGAGENAADKGSVLNGAPKRAK